MGTLIRRKWDDWGRRLAWGLAFGVLVLVAVFGIVAVSSATADANYAKPLALSSKDCGNGTIQVRAVNMHEFGPTAPADYRALRDYIDDITENRGGFPVVIRGGSFKRGPSLGIEAETDYWVTFRK